MKICKKGFTLLEMMVTLVLLAMILSMCYAILFATLESTERVEGMVESGKTAQGVLQIISRDLEGVYSYDMEKTFVGKKEFDQNEVFFTTWIPSKEGSLKKIHYHLKKNPDFTDRWILFRGVSSGASSGGPSNKPSKNSQDFSYQEIYAQIVKLRFQYWQNDSWIDEWKEKKPPKAVKVSLDVPQKSFGSKKILIRSYTTIVSLPSGD